MNAPAVSVVLPTFNRTALLPRSAGSVLAQSFADFELIVVDDGSTEDVEATVAALDDPRVRYVRRNQRGGVAAARNSGVAIARGRYLAFQDSDDAWLPQKLERQLAALRDAGPEYGMVICGLRRLSGTAVRNFPLHDREWKHDIGPRDVLWRPIAYTQTWLVERAAVVSCGGFDENLCIWDDWELLMRLSRVVRIRPLREPLVDSERVPDSLSHDLERFVRDMPLILDKHAGQLAGLPRERAQLHYLYGRRLAVSGRVADARRVLRQAIRSYPLSARAWGMYVSTLLGQRFVTARFGRVRPGD